MSNAEIISLTETRQSLMDALLAIKLGTYALANHEECIAIFKKYPFIKEEAINYFQSFKPGWNSTKQQACI